jgi:transposase
LWEEYIADVPDGYGLTQFAFHLRQQLVARKPAMVLSYTPAEKLYVDFAGHKLSYVDTFTGECIECPVFVACLPFSDYAFAIVVRSQRIEDFIYALIKCLEFLGGSPVILVPDNLKPAVIRANIYGPELNKALKDFCNHYGITILPTRVASPRDKSLVENLVKLVYARVIIASQLPAASWFDVMSESTVADAILDRLVHTSHQIELKGETLRKKR